MTCQVKKPNGYHDHENGDWIVLTDNEDLIGYPMKKRRIREKSITVNITYQEFLRIFPDGKSANRAEGLRLLPKVRSEIARAKELGYNPLAVFFEVEEFHYKRSLPMDPVVQYKVKSVVDGVFREFLTLERDEAVALVAEKAAKGAESISFTTVNKPERRSKPVNEVSPAFKGEKGLSCVTISVHLSSLQTYMGWVTIPEYDKPTVGE